MTDTVFYSWQKDLPNNTNRSFIEQALQRAVKSIREDGSVSVEPVIDRDTAGIPGSPEIAQAIFSKIDQATIFACDVSIIINAPNLRPTPNPNVLIELGYALKALGSTRIIMIMNESFGRVEDLPFDLRTRRIITYSALPESSDRAGLRRNLQARLESELRAIFNLEDFKNREDSSESYVPELRLQFYKMGRDRTRHEDITFGSEQNSPQRHQFGIALVNLSKATPAKGIHMRIEFSWRGNDLNSGPSFSTQNNSPWKVNVAQILAEQPAVLTLSDSQLGCFYGHPIEWDHMRVTLRERAKGYVLARYILSSEEPQSHHESELKIHFN